MRHVSDGDTFVLDNGRKVRLLGVDTPEMDDASRNRTSAKRQGITSSRVQAYAEKAKAFTKNAVEGKEVRLEYDWQRTDKYGRLLAYAYRKEDGLFLNEEILRTGVGFSYTYFPFKYSQRFKSLEKEARRQRVGLWGDVAT